MLLTATENGLGNLVVSHCDLRRSQRAGALELLANERVDGRAVSHEHECAEDLILGGRRRNVVAQGGCGQIELELCLAQHRHGLAEVCLAVMGGPQLVPILGEVTNRAVFERLCDGHPVTVHVAKRTRVGLPAIADGLDALLLRNPTMLDGHVDALVAHGGHRRGAVREGPDLRRHLGDGGGVVVSQVLEDVTRKASRQLGTCVARPNDRIEGVLVPLQDLVRHAVPPAFLSDWSRGFYQATAPNTHQRYAPPPFPQIPTWGEGERQLHEDTRLRDKRQANCLVGAVHAAVALLEHDEFDVALLGCPSCPAEPVGLASRLAI